MVITYGCLRSSLWWSLRDRLFAPRSYGGDMSSNVYSTSQKPKFTGFSQASGQATLLSEISPEKLNTFGWKVTTNEESYSSDTLIGNWNEERFDVKNLKRNQPLPSQHNHYFESTYTAAFNRAPTKDLQSLKYNTGHEPKAFPAHQPALDPHTLKEEYNSFLTASREAYTVPQLSPDTGT